MSYYNSSSSSSSSHYFGPSSFNSSSSYYNDMYRSYSNLRSLPPSYSQPFYLSSGPFTATSSSSYSRRVSPPSSPCILKPYSKSKSPCLLTRSSTVRVLPPPSSTTTTTVSEKLTKTTISEVYAKTDEESIRLPVTTLTVSAPNSHESIYSNSAASTPVTSTHTIGSVQQPTAVNNLSNQELNESNDVNATAISSIRLNCTDDLTTQVDYYLNEVDNRMICRGKTIELESFELSGKSGLISKCLYLNDLLTEANLSETNLESDPIFGAGDTGKCSLLFVSIKDSEHFANKHSDKFTVIFTNDIEKSKLPSKKNVSFNEANDDNNEFECNNKSKSILKTNSNQLSQSKSCDSISSKATIGLGSQLRTNSNENLSNDSNLLVSTNSSKKSKTEGYEILTIRAKLKQRVGQNRSKPVELHDIDSIMRNVVTIIQDEFMKRFPSGPSPNAIKSN